METKQRSLFLTMKKLKVDLHDKTKHKWSKCHREFSQLWSMGYHIPSELTGLTVILKVYGETRKQCEERASRIRTVLDTCLIEEVSK